MSTWIWVNATYFVAGIDVNENGIITKAPFICRWCVGRKKEKFKQYLEGRKVLLDWLERND